jgi:hypothetical protein
MTVAGERGGREDRRRLNRGPLRGTAGVGGASCVGVGYVQVIADICPNNFSQVRDHRANTVCLADFRQNFIELILCSTSYPVDRCFCLLHPLFSRVLLGNLRNHPFIVWTCQE